MGKLKILLVFHLILLFFICFQSYDILTADKFSPYYIYSLIWEIRNILWIQLSLNIIFIIYWGISLFTNKLIIISNIDIRIFINLCWFSLIIILKGVEIMMRPRFYCGEITDKLGDEFILLLFIFPIIQIINDITFKIKLRKITSN